MGQSNADRVRAIIPPDGTDLVVAFGPGGSFSADGLVADDAQVRMVARDAAIESTGPDGFYRTWANWLEPWETYRIYADDVIERGDEVVVRVRLRAVTTRDGVELEHEGAAVFRFEDGLVREITFTMGRSGLSV